MPSGVETFRLGAAQGYIVERAEVVRGKPEPFVILTGTPIMPWNEAVWERELDAGRRDTANYSYAKLAHSLLATERKGAPPQLDIAGVEKDVRTIAELRKQMNNRLVFLLMAADLRREAAFGAGLAHIDTTVKEGREYVYRVSISKLASAYPMKAGTVRASARRFYPAINTRTITAQENDGSILLEWPKDTDHSSYLIERAREGMQDFKRLTSLPYLTMRNDAGPLDGNGYLDSSITNNVKYRYRIFGNTHFADHVLLGEVVAMGRDRTPPHPPRMVKARTFGTNRIRVSWEHEQSQHPDFAGYVIGRDTAVRGNFTAVHAGILPPSTTSFIDSTFRKARKLYYMVRPVDTAGNLGTCMPVSALIIDTIAPAIPVPISANMAKDGVVTITIRRNTEEDLLGYRLFIASDPAREFAIVKETFRDSAGRVRRDTVFIDSVTLRSLSPFVYYRISALDVNFNQSPLSAAVAVRRHDIIAPVAPVVKSFRVTERSIVVTYVPSSSVDTRRHNVLRRQGRDTTWRCIAALSARDSTFMDTTVQRGVMYQYALTASDSAGNVSLRSNSISGRLFDAGVRPAVTHVTARFDSTTRRVTLGWVRPTEVDMHELLIYRSINGSLPRVYAVLTDMKKDAYIDTRVSFARAATYRIILRTKDGGTSPFSDSVSVLIR